YAVMAHPAIDALTGDFGDLRSPSEAVLQQLALPILDVIEALHKDCVLYGALSAEEILLDRSAGGGVGVPVIAGFGSLYQWRGMAPPRPKPDDSPCWAPEFYDRQAGLTGAADLYAIGAFLYRLMTGTSPAGAKERQQGHEHPSIFDAAATYSIGLKR